MNSHDEQLNPARLGRSMGVTLLAWVFIIGGGFGLARLVLIKDTYQAYIAMYSMPIAVGIISYGVVRSIASLIAGLRALKLKEWARKAIVIISLATILFNVVYLGTFIINPKKINQYMEKNFQTAQQDIKTKYQGEQQTQQLQTLEYQRATAAKMMVIYFYIILAISCIWNGIIIKFFLNKHVKQQFA